MSESPSFCTGCGAALGAGRFCTSCGRPVAAPTAPASPPVGSPVPAGERVVGTLPGLTYKKSTFSKKVTYTLVATERRLLFVEMSNDDLKEAALQARAEAKESGKGFFGQWGAQFGALGSYGDRFVAMPVEQILAIPGTWALDRAAVGKIRLKAGMSSDDQSTGSPDTLLIKTVDGKYVFEVAVGTHNAHTALVEAQLI